METKAINKGIANNVEILYFFFNHIHTPERSIFFFFALVTGAKMGVCNERLLSLRSINIV